MKIFSVIRTAPRCLLTSFATLCVLGLGGCSSAPSSATSAAAALSNTDIDRVETTADATSTSRTPEEYKHDLALRISQVNSTKVYPGNPQPLLRAVIVLKFAVDGRGRLMRSDIVRTNHDSEAEATAMASLRNTAPFPKPAASLLRNGRIEVTETWLFNNDGRFQIRSVAQPQLDSR